MAEQQGGRGGGDRGGRGRGRDNRRDEEQSEFVDKLVGINRVAKTVKGGKNFGFAASTLEADLKKALKTGGDAAAAAKV
ncbi:MAG: hypothetical protein AAFR33_08430, partial [Pseudomonadota bacterium]